MDTVQPIRASYPEFHRLILERINEILPRELSARANADEQDDHIRAEPGDEADITTFDTSADYFFRLASRDQQQLLELKAALDRMSRGVYGICENCERPIAIERLRKMPAARFCIECQANMERTKILSLGAQAGRRIA